ncbi:MAG: sugar transferase [Anaerolineales bacterium]|nr:MAG: sugar transferase [Anaerolineales bacterium]
MSRGEADYFGILFGMSWEQTVKNTESKRSRWRLQTGERQLLLIIGDTFAAALATFIALYLWAQFDWFGFSLSFVRFRGGWFILLPIAWLFLMVNNYDVFRAASWRESLKGTLISTSGGIFLYLIVYFSSDPGSLPRRAILYFLVLVLFTTLIWRRLYIKVFTTPNFMRRVLIVGAGESGRTMLNVYKAINPAPFSLVGFIDDDPEKQGQSLDDFPVLGESSKLISIIEAHEITDLIVAVLGPMSGNLFQVILDAQEQGVAITRMPLAYEEYLGRLPIQHLESDWLLRSFVDEVRVSALYTIITRILDLTGSLVGLFACALVLPWVSFAISIESGRPIFYKQPRLGQGGKVFSVVKFRTMRQDAEADGGAHWAQEGDTRTTRVGQLLRKAHIDEFPQFWNVLRGEMSIVGPRPERPELVAELEQQIPFYRARLLSKPGITGWAQVNYGKGASVQGSAEKLEFDLYYIKHRSINLNIWIILKTVGSIFGLRGV